MLELLSGANRKPAVNADTKLLCHFNGANGARATTDEKGNTCTFNLASNLALRTAAAKFGTAGLASVGAVQQGGLIISGNQIIPTDNSDWTIEFWLQLGGGTAGGLYSILNYDTLFVRQGSGPTIGVGDTKNTFGTTTSVIVNTYNHVALVKHEGKIYFYVGGKLIASATHTTLLAQSTINLFYTAYNSPNYSSSAYMDELRISHGARYLAPFTPPVAAFAS